MSSTPQALLLVFSENEPGVSTQDFNAWYDGEHAPARLTVPGITSVTRYKAADGEKPDWVALYDMASLEIAKSPAVTALRDNASDNEKKIIPRLPVLQRRNYSLVTQSVKPGLSDKAVPGKYLLVVLWSVPAELDEDFHKFYDEEHTDLCSKVPGWLRGRRFKLEEGADLVAGKGPPIQGWNYLVMHDWENGNYAQTPEFKAAIETPWAKKIMGSANGLTLRMFELHKNFE